MVWQIEDHDQFTVKEDKSVICKVRGYCYKGVVGSAMFRDEEWSVAMTVTAVEHECSALWLGVIDETCTATTTISVQKRLATDKCLTNSKVDRGTKDHWGKEDGVEIDFSSCATWTRIICRM